MGFRERYLNRAMQLEFAPIAVFFLVNWLWGLMAATAAVMAATVLCVALGWRLERRIPVFGIVTVALVVVMGGLTLVFDDADFIKVKPTVGKLLFALALLVGMHLRPSMLERALGTMVFLSARGWRVLHWRWIGLAVMWAGANEVARRVLTTDEWVTFVTVLSIASIVSYIVCTRLTAPAYWTGPVDD
jgi:intracellular septation protein